MTPKQTRYRIGFWLIALGPTMTALLTGMEFAATHIGKSINCEQLTIELLDVKLAPAGLLIVAGVLVLLPVADWIAAWKGGK